MERISNFVEEKLINMVKRLLLGSKSPRRREILSLLKIPFTVVTIEDEDETYPEDLAPEEVSEYLSKKKANLFLDRINENEILITADTVVISEGKILGKPKDAEDAKNMLRQLSGRTHKVTTGVTIATKEKRESFTSETLVTFAKITEEEIEFYVKHYLPLDKAGAYGIQEWIGAVAVEKINGSFYNVMGLPVHRLYQALKNF